MNARGQPLEPGGQEIAIKSVFKDWNLRSVLEPKRKSHFLVLSYGYRHLILGYINELKDHLSIREPYFTNSWKTYGNAPNKGPIISILLVIKPSRLAIA